MEQKTDAQKTILIVEDEKNIVDILRFNLQREGYRTVEAYDGADGLEKARKENPDLILLDVMLPGEDGVSLLKKMKAAPALRDIPVIMATAKGAEYDKIQSLDLGADDYLVKPFAMEELLARLRVLTRRKGSGRTNVFTLADLTVDTAARSALRAGTPLTLSAREYALLEYLIRNKGIILSREQIENNLWNYDYAGGTNVVDVYISYLRKKLDGGHEKKLLHTVRGMGWVLKEDV